MWKRNILLFIYISATSAYDLEVMLNVDDELFNKVKSLIDYRNNPAAVELDLNVPANIASLLRTFDKPQFRSVDLQEPSPQEPSPQNFESTFKELVEELTKRGTARLKSTSGDVEKQFKTFYGHVNPHVASRLESATARLAKKFQKYSQRSAQVNATIPLDKELVIQDTVDGANVIIFNETKRFLEKIKKFFPVQATENLRSLLETAYKQNLLYRKEDYKYICEKYSLCRAYPGYFDFLGGLLREVIELSDSKLHTLLMKIERLTKTRYLFFETVIGKDIIAEVSARLQDLVDGDLSDIRQTLSMVREIINQRRRWIYDNNVGLNDQKRATRIIMDVVDEAFSKDGEDAVMSIFDTTVKALREWARGARNDIETIVFAFVTYTIDTLEKKWESSTTQEVYTLAQQIWTGKTTEGNEYLLRVGSNYTSKLIATN